MSTKYIFVVGGVMSGIGKGVATSSIGKILQSRGWKVSAMKIDPYINLDAGTMNPTEHGEVFVTEDGLECDQDIGNYERFLGIPMRKLNYMTTGMVYQSVINRERNLEYKGKCVEVVPHIPEEVLRRITLCAKKGRADIQMIEIGGTVGEYQNLLFLEAARILKLKYPDDVLFVMVSFLPIPKKIGEMKTKPTQYAVRTLNSAGIQTNLIIARSEKPLDKPRKRKISIFCNLLEKDIISAPDIDSIYDVPVNFEKDRLGDRISEKLKLHTKKRDLKGWRKIVNSARRSASPVKIGIVGKYFTTGNFSLSDSYISVLEAIKHASWHLKRSPHLVWLNAESYERSKRNLHELDDLDGVVIPGGFGPRGTEGKIKAIEYCRKNNIPILGLCYGMQLMVVEFSRNAAHIKKANTTEVNPKTPNPVIDVMDEQKDNIKGKNMGGTMRLGNYDCKIVKGTLADRAYKSAKIRERHRHRYEVNNKYSSKLEKNGLVISGVNPQRNLAEIIELKNHPFYVGTQFHPEFTSTFLAPNPIFREFVATAIKKSKSRQALDK